MSPVGVRARLEVAIETKRFASRTAGERHALGPLHFAVRDGEVVAIVGPSGCGKTTLLRLIAGLDREFQGRISRSPQDRLGLVFQEPRLLPWRSVEANVRLAAPEADDLDALFSAFSLSEHRKHFPGELSLGLARRVALVRALALKPDLLLLDEPFASLDLTMRLNLVATLGQMISARRLTTLMITHDLDAAAHLSDRILVVSKAPARIVRQIEVRTPREQMTREAAAALIAEIGAVDP